MARFGPFFLFALSLAAVAPAQDVPSIPDVHQARLDNGLRILVLEDHSQPRIACKILYHFGAVVEEPGRLGSAHFLEHLLFKGTATIGTEDWDGERPLLEKILRLEEELLQERNRARRELRQRGVFLDYQHQTTTPQIEEIEAELRRTIDEHAPFVDTSEIMSYYQRVGGTRLTATTEQEYMKFDINLPSEKLEIFFRVEADRMVNSQWRQFEPEAMILWEQRLGDLNRPATPFREALASVSGFISPIYWNEGYPTDFPLLDRHYTRHLYETWFVPNNTILVFVGDTTLAKVVPLAERYFGSIPRGTETRDTLAVEPAHGETIRVEMTTPHYGPAIDLRHRIPGVGHPDRPAVELLREIVGARRGPLGEATVGSELAASISANTFVTHTDRFSFPGTLNIVVQGKTIEGLPVLEKALLASVEELTKTPIDRRTIELAKKRRRAYWERRRLNWDDVAFDLGHYEIMDSWKTLYREMDAVQKLTGEDLQHAAQKYLIDANRIIGVARRGRTKAPSTEETGGRR
jgi:predicted Zn-dependent peptidase